MKIKIIVASLFLGSLISATSCKKFLNEEPDQSLNEDSIFANLANTRAYLSQIYANIPDPYANRFNGARSGPYNMIADDANWISQSGFPSTVWSYSTANASVSVASNIWGEFYKPIRNATDFIAKIDDANPTQVNAFLRGHYKAEARAMRAIYYFWLLRLYGPVVVLPEMIDVSASNQDLMKERTPFDSCINYVVTELDQAYDEINAVATAQNPADQPLTGSNGLEYGRITTGVCKAYKEQALMLAASPLFNGNSLYANLKNADGTQLVNQTYDQNKWKKAADAAKTFIDQFVPSTYNLYTETDTNAYMAAYKACRDVVQDDWNSEWIFGKSVSGNVGYYNYNFYPKLVGYTQYTDAGGGYGAVNQSLVDDYFMKNGLPINDPNSGYQTSGFSSFKAPFDVASRSTYNQWTNREPRFYVGVTYTNSYWLNQGTSPNAVIVDFTYSGNSGAIQSTTDHSSTGYLIRKNVASSGSNRSWVYLRLAQIYLDYAEALNEYDPGNADILKYVNLVRARAGIPTYGSAANQTPAPEGQVSIREAIRKERRVELAHEEVRYFDVRRWMIATDKFNQPVYGMNIYKNGNDFYTKTLEFQPKFQSRDYLWPIPSAEIRKDSKLVQNPGW